MMATESSRDAPGLLVEIALSYAARGFHIFPCIPRSKKPLTPHGLIDATTDEATIRKWWARWPDANIAVATGATSGVVVLDADKKPEKGIDGEEALRALERQHGELSETITQLTGGGGSQRFFQHPGGIITNSVGKLGLGIDVRGDGGYVIVPPSIHPNGRRYEWELSCHPEETPLTSLPPAWVALLRSLSNGNGSRTHAAADSEPIGEGQRNDTLFRFAGFMRAKGASHGAILAALMAENEARCQPPMPEEEVRRIAESVSKYHPGGNSEAHEQQEDNPKGDILILTRLSDVTPQPVRWLWRGRIPLGKVTVLDGDPGLGKSLLSTDIAARVTTASRMPDGTESDLCGPAGVVILSAEDDPADTICPRLEAADADLSRIAALTAIREGEDERLPTLLDLEAIRQAIQQVNARLVIIDPLMAYLPSKVDSHRDQDIRRSLAPLAALAAETGVAVLVIRHLNKAEGRNALYRGGGSIGIIGAARSGLLVAKDPEDEDRRILAVTKSNLAKLLPALAYRVTATANEIPSLSWEGTTDHTAASLLAQPVDGEDRSTLEEAKDFLREVLANGAALAKDVQKQAGQAGINERTLRRAKAALKIISRKQGGFFSKDKGSQQWCWVLPPSESQPAAEDGQDSVCEHLQEPNEHLQGWEDEI